MLKYFAILILLFTTTNTYLLAQKSKANDKSLLWRISKKDLKKPSYLFGTIHIICKQDYIWTPAMQNSFKNTEEVCFEMDLDDPNMMMQVAMGVMSTDGKRLKDYFNEADYQKLSKYVSDSLNMDISMFDQMKPVALETLFSTNTNSICDSPQSYENNIMAEAKKQNKEILGLETVSEQLDLFDNLPIDTVIKDIMSVVNGKSSDENEYQKLVAAYKKQDLPALYKYIKESGELDKDLGGFLDVRNEKWVPKMITMMDSHAMFFAVGAGHLYGENGLISLLRKAGYTVTALKQ